MNLKNRQILPKFLKWHGLWALIFLSWSLLNEPFSFAQKSQRPELSVQPHSAVRNLLWAWPDRRNEVKEQLNIHTSEDVVEYYKAHQWRVYRGAEEAIRAYLEEALDVFQIPEEHRNLKKLEALILHVVSKHDLAKLDESVAEGLLRLIGVDKNAITTKGGDRYRRGVMERFFDYFNRHDTAISEQAFEEKFKELFPHLPEPVKSKLKEMVFFFDKVSDQVDRAKSWEAAIEFGKKMILPSLLKKNSKYLDDLIQNRKILTLFRKVAAHLESQYQRYAAGESYAERKSQREAVQRPKSYISELKPKNIPVAKSCRDNVVLMSAFKKITEDR